MIRDFHVVLLWGTDSQLTRLPRNACKTSFTERREVGTKEVKRRMHSYRILTKRRIYRLLRGYMRYQSELIHVQSAPGTGEVHAVHHTLGHIVFYHGIMKIAGDTANISSSRVHVQRATEIKADASHCEFGLRSTSLHRTEITSSQNTGETTTSLPAPLTHCDGRTQGTVSDKQPSRAPELTHTPSKARVHLVSLISDWQVGTIQ